MDPTLTTSLAVFVVWLVFLQAVESKFYPCTFSNILRIEIHPEHFKPMYQMLWSCIF